MSVAVTFTVGAAEQMRVRLVALLGHDGAAPVTVATFHALCARILRAHAAVFGRSSAFSIYDQADVGRIIRDLLADEHEAPDGAEGCAQVGARIGLAQSRLESPATLRARGGDERVAAVWEQLEAELARCRRMLCGLRAGSYVPDPGRAKPEHWRAAVR